MNLITLKTSIVILTILLITNSCKKDINSINDSVYKEKIAGVIQKGPYLNGTSITIFELNKSLKQTGKTFTSEILNNSGVFEFSDIELVSQFIEIQADGFYFNEISGENSSSPLKLNAFSDIKNKNTVNVNLLTHLVSSRAKYLIQNDISFETAKDSAKKEILAIFGWEESQIDNSELLDISKPNDGNAILLALSVILQHDLSVSDLAELLANINKDIREDGILNSEAIKSSLYNGAKSLDLKLIRQNINERYKSLNVEAVLPDFESKIAQYLWRKKPFIINALVTDVTCKGIKNGIINITVQGGTPPFTYKWSNGSKSKIIENLSPGTYWLTVTDANNYIGYSQVKISEPEQVLNFEENIKVKDVSCADPEDGAIDIAVSGGIEPYTYIWSNGETDEDITNIAAGEYVIKVLDSNLCEIEKVINVKTEQPSFEIDITKKDISSVGSMDGEIDITVTGDTAPYAYQWSNGNMTEDINNLAEGKYTVKVVDSKTCEKEMHVFIDKQGTVSDIDRNVYNTAIIGNKEWMTENLRTTTLNDGTRINLVTDNDDWINTKSNPAYCWYINDKSYALANEYGALYNGVIEMTDKVCPAGWHLPTLDEWDQILDGWDQKRDKISEFKLILSGYRRGYYGHPSNWGTFFGAELASAFYWSSSYVESLYGNADKRKCAEIHRSGFWEGGWQYPVNVGAAIRCVKN